MQLVLELLKKIFVALQSVYTKPEIDSALAVRDTNIAAQQRFNAAVARATVEYVKNPTVDVALTASDSPYINAIDEPIVDFRVKSIGQGAIGSNFCGTLCVPNASSLAYGLSGTKVERIVMRFVGAVSLINFFYKAHSLEDVDIEGENNIITQSMFHSCSNLKKARVVSKIGTFSSCAYMFYAASVKDVVISFWGQQSCSFLYEGISLASTNLERLVLIDGLPIATSITLSYGSSKNTKLTHIRFSETDESNQPIDFPLVETATASFKNYSVLDQTMTFPSLQTGDDMFLDSGLSAANISAVLDSLPSNPVDAGGTGIITFTGCPGASELTQESESVAAATAKGWTVEL